MANVVLKNTRKIVSDQTLPLTERPGTLEPGHTGYRGFDFGGGMPGSRAIIELLPGRKSDCAFLQKIIIVLHKGQFSAAYTAKMRMVPGGNGHSEPHPDLALSFCPLDPLLGCIKVGLLFLKADELTASTDTCLCRGARPHAVIQNQITLIGICFYKTFTQRGGFLCWMDKIRRGNFVEF